jgi:hypothetical protein
VTCPLEKRFAAICNFYDIAYKPDDAGSGLDFFLPDFNVYVEVKRFHSPRIAEQMSRRPDVIAIQGEGAMKAFSDLLAQAAKDKAA